MLATKNGNDDVKSNGASGMVPPAAGSYRSASIVLFPILFFLALTLFLAGCAPPGARALVKGKKLLDQGDYAAAVEQLRLATATPMLATNAQAWNYLGVACQGTGQTADAVAAYQRALALDRDLMEAHFNLGSLWLAQNKYDAAKAEFTAYTLRRPNAPEGWLNLGTAQLRTGDLTLAEKSFGTAYYYDTNNAEALNGLGLVQVKRGHPREASQFFAAAIQYHPDYAPAILNQATVAQEDLHDHALALACYRKYLALTPRPANWNEVNALVNDLEKPATTAATPPNDRNRAPDVTARTTTSSVPAATPPTEVKPRKFVSSHSPEPPHHKTTQPVPTDARVEKKSPPPNYPAPQVQVQDEPAVVSSPGKPGVLQRMNPMNWFATTDSPADKKHQPTVTPLPPAAPAYQLPPAAPPTFPRYLYRHPRPPASGDRVAAAAYFNRAREYEQSSRWTEALECYRRAIQADPGWFPARYNYSVLAYRLRNYDAALAEYETALAIEPGSVDARYNFALTLKAAGYALDAVNELKQIIAAHPAEVRAQLALANLYAQQLRDPADARIYYKKVLALDPGNAQATDIHYWLQANPP